MASTTGDSEKTMHHDAHNSATIAEDATIASKRQAAIEAREQALQAKADAVRAKAQFKAEAIRAKAEEKARHKLAKEFKVYTCSVRHRIVFTRIASISFLIKNV